MADYIVEPEAVCLELHQLAHERLRNLQELDEATKIPFVLVELTGERDGEGEIEICGKDEYGIYEALDQWLVANWGCEALDAGDLCDETKIPFCKAQYKWPGFAVTGEEGLNNMGLRTMQLVDFVCGQLSWTLAIVNGGNVGADSEVREQQIIFKAPHPMNLVAPHMMIELRSAGYIEISADLEEADSGVLDRVDEFIMQRFEAQRLEGFEDYCNRYYRAGDGIFKGTAGSADNNLSILTMQVCDTVVNFPGWSLVAISSDNYGDDEHQEQQLVFRRDYHPLNENCYLMATIRSSGIVEVTGKDQNRIQARVGKYLQGKWGCERTEGFREGDTLCGRYTWQASDVLDASILLTGFFEMCGWEMQVCSQQMIRGELRRQRTKTNVSSSSVGTGSSVGAPLVKEQQLLFRPGATEVGVVEPHLFVEMYAGEGKEELYDDEEATQVLANQRIRLKPLAPRAGEGLARTSEALKHLDGFIVNYLGGAQLDDEKGAYSVNVFMGRGRFENNLGQWTMRLCDFLVDRLGWSFLVCSLCNQGELGQFRAQQLVFRYDGDKRDVPVSAASPFNNLDQSEWAETALPDHWMHPAIISGEAVHQVVKCTSEEKEALQEMVDSTFKRTLTRDRMPDDDAPEDMEIPYRLEVVDAFRSEHRWLHHRLEERRKQGLESFDPETAVMARTAEPIADSCLAPRLGPGDGYLFHGTNPSSAMSILRTGFVLEHAGSSRGTMFGHGIYMAERSSKSDEYGRDDGGNTYPGLRALLVCRCFVGRPLVVTQKGDYVAEAIADGLDCVLGDRESKVGTYREFVFFDEAQVFPEYSVIYRRQYSPDKVPPEMVMPTTGTTGRFWQIRTEPTVWKNLPTEVGKVLSQSAKDGETVVNITLRGIEYAFDLEAKQGTNQMTGNSVRLRAPMQ